MFMLICSLLYSSRSRPRAKIHTVYNYIPMEIDEMSITASKYKLFKAAISRYTAKLNLLITVVYQKWKVFF